MKIGIDARMMSAENTRGIGRYIQELVKAMTEVAPENEYALVTRQPDHALSSLDNIQTVVADIPWYGLQEQFKMPGVLKSLRADAVHVPHWNVPLFYQGPLVVTIHDLLLRHQPASAKASTKPWPIRNIKHLGYNFLIGHAIKTARQICVPTNFVQKDLLSFYSQAAGKIVVTGEGITSFNAKCITPKADPAASIFDGGGKMQNAKCDVPTSSFEFRDPIFDGKYLLYVGSAYPHKRLDLLLEAWREVSRLWPDMKLVIAGEMDIFMEKQRAKSKEQNIFSVKFLGRVTDQELADLYQGALALVFPSGFEGFGLPPLEALAQGCPVVSSDAGPMLEVLGKKGVRYFKSGSKDGMLGAIKTVVDNRDEFQKQARQAGPELAARHSWHQAAVKTLQAYQSAVLG